MTLEELNALPEIGGIGYREETIDGRTVRAPYSREDFALFQKNDDPAYVIDDQGRHWMIGWKDGVRYKRLARG